jgi:STE24 endopeptidase
MSWSKGLGAAAPTHLKTPVALAIFFGGYAVVLLALRGWATFTTRRAREGAVGSSARFQQAMHLARLWIPAWLGVGIYLLNWGWFTQSLLPVLYRWPSAAMHLELPQAVLGTLPAMLAWIGLWWAQFPTERSLREQSVLVNLDEDLPVHAPPTFRESVGANFRLQIAFTLAPVLFILALRDLTAVILGLAGLKDAKGFEDLVMLPATVCVFVFAPEILRRVLRTEKLPDSPLRQRLEAMCRSAKLRYRDILLWRTDCTMGNAAVMGLFPRVRYVLLSDLLLETMTDQQIEAVFAHEVGHVVHKHLWWFVAFIGIAMLAMSGPGNLVMTHFQQWYMVTRNHSLDSWETIEGLVATALFFGSFVLALGFLSPRFERQADVYAARTMQKHGESDADASRPNPAEAVRSTVDGGGVAEATLLAPLTPLLSYARPSYVGEFGAGVFAGALHRVAVINHIPVSAGNWSHGSIAHRMRALYEMSASPSLTSRFDRAMRRLYVGLILCLCVFGTWNVVPLLRNSAQRALQPTVRIVPSPAVGAGR